MSEKPDCCATGSPSQLSHWAIENLYWAKISGLESFQDKECAVLVGDCPLCFNLWGRLGERWRRPAGEDGPCCGCVNNNNIPSALPTTCCGRTGIQGGHCPQAAGGSLERGLSVPFVRPRPRIRLNAVDLLAYRTTNHRDHVVPFFTAPLPMPVTHCHPANSRPSAFPCGLNCLCAYPGRP